MRFVRFGIFVLSENKATLSGAVDVVAVQHQGGIIRSTNFHVRFGRLNGVLHPKEKVVRIRVNGKESSMKMKLGVAGAAFFVHEVLEPGNDDYDTSPLYSPIDSPLHGAAEHRPPSPLELGMVNSETGDVKSDGENSVKSDDDGLSNPPQIVRKSAPSLAEVDRDANQGSKSWTWSWGWGEGPRRQLKEEEEAGDEDTKGAASGIVDEADGDGGGNENENESMSSGEAVKTALVAEANVADASGDEQQGPLKNTVEEGTQTASSNEARNASFHESAEEAVSQEAEGAGGFFSWFTSPPQSPSGIQRGMGSSGDASQPVVPNEPLRLSITRSEEEIIGGGYYRKTFRPSPEQLQEMGLEMGENQLEFSVMTVSGTVSTVSCRLFLWPEDARLSFPTWMGR